MQPKKFARSASLSVKTLSLAIASSCLFYSGADAAGLGKLTVLSALGQPLKAEIELTSIAKDDAGNLVTKLASAEAYRQANIGYDNSLSALSFSIEQRGSRLFVLVTSKQSVNEPFLELLVELNSSTGKLVREYTVLLDPVEMQANNGAISSTSGTTVSVQPTTTPVSAAPSPTVSTSIPAATQTVNNTVSASPAKNAQSTSNAGATYEIKSGDTLSKIANQYKPQGVSLEQMLVALQRSNSAAFINNNMNLIRAGRIISIPDTAEIEQTNQAEAKKIVLAQSADFNGFRNKLATQVEQAQPEKEVAPKKSEGGKITAKVTEAPTPVSESKDKLKLSKAQQQELADKKALEEEKIAKQRALEAANARVKELEANTAKLQGILDLKNKAAAAKTASEHAAAPAVASAPAVAAASTPAPAITANVPPPVVAPKPAPVAKPPGLLDNWMKYLPYGAGGLLLIGLIGLFASKRKKKVEKFDDESLLTGSSIKTNSLFGSTGGQSVDTNNSVFNSNFAPSASQLDANEVDPVAEADVYIAYGRDEQAEEILKEALRSQPDRQAVRVKLLEIYAHRKDTRTFETVASELYGMTSGEGPDWAQAAALGIIIDPQNPLYAGGHSIENQAVLGASTLPVESLDPEALLGNSLSQEMLDSLTAKSDANNSGMLGDINERTHRSDEMETGLDFDLGLTTSNEVADEFGAPIKPAAASGNSSDFTLDLPNENHSTDHGVLDLSLDNVPTPTAAINSAGTAHEAGAVDFSALDFDFDIPKSGTNEPAITSNALQPADLNAGNVDKAVETKQSRSSALEYDLSNIDLDLTNAPTESGIDMASLLPANSSKSSAGKEIPDLQDIATETDSDEPSAEMATKLDLAVAYQEIGDKDGARELLDEVIKGGNSEQIARAQKMLQELA